MTTPSIFKTFLVAALVLSLSLTTVLAEDSATTTSNSSGKTAESVREKLKTEKEARKAALEAFKTAEKEQNVARKLTSAQSLANKLIAEREKALAQAKTKSAEVKCVAAKTDIGTAIDAVSANLASQKAEVAAATTVDAIKAIIKDGIIGKNHVFVAILPALRGMCASDSIKTLIDGRLATVVTKLKTAGLDTTAIEKYLADAKASAQTAYDLYKAVANNPGSATYQADLATAKASLKAAKESLGLAKTEAEKLRDQSATTTEDSTKKTED
ncbi:MAG: hypothetical protein Q7R48_03975 [bacterium]|nr:hypothetical protein [bacterium]